MNYTHEQIMVMYSVYVSAIGNVESGRFYDKRYPSRKSQGGLELYEHSKRCCMNLFGEFRLMFSYIFTIS